MQPSNRIYYFKIYWRLNMFRAAYRSSSGAQLFSASGLYTHVVTGRCPGWVETGWPVPTQPGQPCICMEFLMDKLTRTGLRCSGMSSGVGWSFVKRLAINAARHPWRAETSTAPGQKSHDADRFFPLALCVFAVCCHSHYAIYSIVCLGCGHVSRPRSKRHSLIHRNKRRKL